MEEGAAVSLQERELADRLKAHGYFLYKVVHFKRFDRIRFGNLQISIAVNLRGKLSELAVDAIIEACIGKGEQP